MISQGIASSGITHRLPRALAVGRSTIGAVNEHQVDILESGLLQGRLYLRLCAVVANQASRHLGGEENLVTGQTAALPDSFAATCLIAVCRGRVNLSSRQQEESPGVQGKGNIRGGSPP